MDVSGIFSLGYDDCDKDYGYKGYRHYGYRKHYGGYYGGYHKGHYRHYKKHHGHHRGGLLGIRISL